MRPVTIYMTCQVDKQGRLLGVRDSTTDPLEAEHNLLKAKDEFWGEIRSTGWPIWVTKSISGVPRKVDIHKVADDTMRGN